MAGHLDLVVETLGDPDDVVVAYREHERDGFIVTAFMPSKADKLIQRGLQWRKS